MFLFMDNVLVLGMGIFYDVQITMNIVTKTRRRSKYQS